MKKKYLVIITTCLILIISFMQGSIKEKKSNIEFTILGTKLNLKKYNTEVYLSVKNINQKEIDLGSFVITLYNPNKNMIVSSGASICDYGKTDCVLKSFETREFTLTVGVDATDTKYIEYRLD